MPRKTFWIAASCILAVIGLRPVLSSGAPPASAYKIIYSFTGGADGQYPVSDLTLDSAGNLYGTTAGGGTGTACNGGCGTVFELKRTSDGWKEEVLHNFLGGLDGSGPQAGVVFDNSGNLYGTTAFGGDVYGDGTVFKLTPNSRGWTERILYSFSYYGIAGKNPAAGLALDAKGNLYGTTSDGASSGKSCNQNGCGAVFELTPQDEGSWTETTIHQFTGGSDGGTPSGGVVLDSEGNLYGATQHGGTGRCRHYAEFIIPGCGTAFKLTRDPGGNWTETVLYNFVRGGGFGLYPVGTPFFESPDHVLGLTNEGGDGLGTVFELHDTKKTGWQQSEAHIFYGSPDGTSPIGGLAMDANGNLFGVTYRGGTASGNGIIFELEHSKSGWRERILHRFSGLPDGAHPSNGLVLDSQGHLYGTTAGGGTATACYSGCGTVYEITP